MRILGRYLFPLLAAVVLVGFAKTSTALVDSTGSFIVTPNQGPVGTDVFFEATIFADPVPQGYNERYNYYFFHDCELPLYPTNTSSGRTVFCGHPNLNDRADLSYIWQIGSSRTFSWRYVTAGTYYPQIYIEQALYPQNTECAAPSPEYADPGNCSDYTDTFYSFTAADTTVTITPPTSAMDVTPDDGNPSGSKSSETCSGSGCGPQGPMSAQMDTTQNYSATFTSNPDGGSRSYRFCVTDPTGYRVCSAEADLTSSSQNRTYSVTFNRGPGTYRVCAWGAQNDTNTEPQVNSGSGLFGFLHKWIKTANALYTGLGGATDEECKNVSVTSTPPPPPEDEPPPPPPGGVGPAVLILVNGQPQYFGWEGENLTISWTSSNAVSCVSDGGYWNASSFGLYSQWGSNVGVSGSMTDQLEGYPINMWWQVQCTDSAGLTATSRADAYAYEPQSNNPFVDLRANGQQTLSGSTAITTADPVTLSWTTEFVSGNCDVSANPSNTNWGGSRAYNSSPQDLGTLPTGTHWFYITCYNADRSKNHSDQVQVVVGNTAFSVNLSVAVSGSGNYQNSFAGNGPVNLDLKADVNSSNTTSNITYTFYCDRADTGTNVTTPYHEQTQLLAHTKVTNTPCPYSSSGNYITKVIARQGTNSVQDQASVTVTTPPPPSGPTNLNVEQDNFFCTNGWLRPRFNWVFANQTAYHIQIDDSSGFTSPLINENTADPSSSQNYRPSSGTFDPSTLYYVRVRAKNASSPLWSGWSNTLQFTTLPYGLVVRFEIEEPNPPVVGQQTFFDNTTSYNGGDPESMTHTWDFDINSSSPPNSSQIDYPDVVAIYNNAVNTQARLTIVTPYGTCSRQEPVGIGAGLNLPIFREIIPR